MMRAALKPWPVALGLCALVALFLILWPLGLGRDYMNHLARTYIEGHLGSDPSLQQYYSLSFDYIPDLTMDMIVPWLSHLIGIYPAGAVTIWLAFVLPPLAGLALAKTLHGRVTWLSLLGFLTVFNANMDLGFVNYTAASGLALLAFVLWIRMRPSWRRTLVFAPLTLFLVMNHALAFLTFGFLAFVWEVANFHKGARGDRWSFVHQLALKDLPAMLPGLVFLYLSMQGASDLPQNIHPLYDFGQKFRALMAATEFGSVALAMFAILALCVFAWVALRHGWIRFAPGMGWVCAAFLALVILVPTAIFGIWGLHLRFVAPLVIVVAASVVPTAAFTPRLQQISLAGFGAIGVALFANGAVQMAHIDRQAQTLRTVLSELPAGAKVFAAVAAEEHEPAFALHAVAMATIERSAFVPGLFTNTSPVDIQPQMADWHMPQGRTYLGVELAALAAQPRQSSANGYWSEAYATAWPEAWDYLLYFKAPTDPGLTDLPVCEVKSTPTMILYATAPCDPAQ